MPATPGRVEVEPTFAIYEAPVLEVNRFKPDDLLVVPETLLVLSPTFKSIPNQRTFIWWLSVDNSPLPWANNYEMKMNKLKSEWVIQPNTRKTWRNYLYELLFEIKFGLLASSPKSKLHRINPKKVNNLCQSAYAMDVLNKRGMRELSYLSDYVEVEGGIVDLVSSDRTGRPRVVYNFAKSQEQVQILKSIDKSIDFIPLSGLTAIEMALEMKRADLFLDLGHFPGKDRLPREAILYGCPVLLARRGAARHRNDFPLDEEFLINLGNETPSDVVSKIRKMSFNKEATVKKQMNFLTGVINQRSTFSREVRDLVLKFESISGGCA